MQAVFLDDVRNIENFISTISKPRLSKYLLETRGREREALLLYHWNSKLSQALYLPLQNWEIALRNRINTFLCWKYNSNWPSDPKAVRNFTHKDEVRLQTTLGRQKARSNGNNPSTNQIVADLSAGFWVSQLGKKYEIPYQWRNNLRFRIFTNGPNLDRVTAASICDGLLNLRNRIAHHEPVFHLQLDARKRELDMVLKALCGSTSDYMMSACSFSEIWNARPVIRDDDSGQMLLGQNL